MICRLILLSLLLFFDGCATIKNSSNPTILLTDKAEFELLGLQKIEQNIELNQLIEAEYDNKKYSLNSALKINNHSLEIIGLNSLGIKFMIMRYDGKNIEFKLSSFIQDRSKIKPEYILGDIQLIYYPLSLIKNNIHGKEIKVVEKNTKRKRKRIFYENNVPFIEITYSKLNLFESVIHYNNLLRNYQYTIKNL